jgi:hypothetical protein
MSRPPLEVADLIRAAGRAFIERSLRWITWQHVKVLLALSSVAPPRSAGISMNAPAADIAPSLSTRAEIATVQSVRRAHATVGWRSVAGNFSRRLTCM